MKGEYVELTRAFVAGTVKSGRLRVRELERDVECDRMLKDGSDGLWRMLFNLVEKVQLRL